MVPTEPDPKKTPVTGHVTDALAHHAEKKIDRMNAATRRLAKLDPAANLSEAMGQIVGE